MAEPAAAVRPAAFALANVRVDYERGRPALANVSLSIESGGRIAVLGANGSGKTTLLKVLGGLVTPIAGTVHAFGQELSERALRRPDLAHAFRRRVGFIFQNPDVQLFCATVREEIAFGPLQMELSRSEVEHRIREVSSLLGIGSLLDEPPFRLSGGEKKKVAFASVLAIEPEVFLLDEPTAGLDPRTRSFVLDLLLELARAGRTLVSATNELDVVPALAERVVVLNEAHGIEALGPTEEILGNERLLRAVNIIHEHAHRHGDRYHTHSHFHGGDHDHEH